MDDVLKTVSSYYSLMERVSVIVAQLDVLTSFAQVSSHYNWVRPQISQTKADDDKDKIVLVDSKHPLIETIDPS